MKLRSGRHILRRRKNIYLPTEVWVDVFCFPWIARWELAQIVDKIGNRWFGEQLQFYLHEWGKHTLANLHFTNQRVSKWHNGQLEQLLDYPQTAMPENIKFCKSFKIEHFDNQVFNFFRRIQSMLRASTKLEIRYIREEEVDNARTILSHLLPLIDGIYTLRTDDRMMPLVKTCMREKFNRIKVLDVHLTCFVQSAVQPIMEWLTTSSNEPKLLQLYSATEEIDQQVVETIHQQFMEAVEPSTFVVLIHCTEAFSDFDCEENAIGEELSGTNDGSDDGSDFVVKFKVFRHQANAEAYGHLHEWLDGIMEKMGGGCDEKQCISFSNPTIGDGLIFAMPDLDEEEADEMDDEDEKPRTSKKRRI